LTDPYFFDPDFNSQAKPTTISAITSVGCLLCFITHCMMILTDTYSLVFGLQPTQKAHVLTQSRNLCQRQGLVLPWFKPLFFSLHFLSYSPDPPQFSTCEGCTSLFGLKWIGRALDFHTTQFAVFIEFPKRTNCDHRWESWRIGNVLTNLFPCRQAIFFHLHPLTGGGTGVSAYLAPEVTVIPVQVVWKSRTLQKIIDLLPGSA
jgi:hypothetical protein